MKRMISYLLCVLLLASMIACGQTPLSSSTATVQAEVLSLQSTEQAIRTAATNTDTLFPSHNPYGAGVGAMPGRVVWAYDPSCVEWDGSGYWWELEHFDETAVQRMVREGIASLAGEKDAVSGWNTLFQAHNAAHSGTGGYRPGQKIAIKANMNGFGTFGDSSASRMSYTNPVVLKALLVSLVADAGVRPQDITVYDASRMFPQEMVTLCTQGELSGIQFRYMDLGGSNDAQADRSVPVVWSQQVSGDTNYLPTCVTEADYLINLAELKGHSYGITLTGKNHFGTLMNSSRLRPPEAAGIHRYLTQNRMNAYTVLVDLMGNYQLGEKTMLYMLDAVICAPSEGSSITGENTRWQQSPFNGGYTSSLFFSQDPVAIDSVGADFLMNEPSVTNRNSALRDNPNVENYLHEAGLVADAPSGSVYYNGNGERVENLGVHEHWNNPTDKQYRRNLGGSEGIELVQVGPNANHTGEMSNPSAQNNFVDVPVNAWYADAVAYCREQGLMSGTTATTFSPNETTSRAMLVTVLYRHAGSPQSTQSNRFSDVAPDAWYDDAVAWASANGIVGGYPDGRFGPDDPVTREQLAAILWRSAGQPEAENGLPFADQESVSAYATPAIAWARERGVISGKSGNRFDPAGQATRAETAAILYRYASLEGQSEAPDTTSHRTLVVYYSLSQRTEDVAKRLQEKTNGDLYELVPSVPYTGGNNAISQRAQEEVESGNYPSLSGMLPDLSQYETILIGGPVWNSTMASPLYTYLSETDFTGKTVAPFWTDQGTPGNYAQDFTDAVKSAVPITEFLQLTNTTSISEGDMGQRLDPWLAAVLE